MEMTHSEASRLLRITDRVAKAFLSLAGLVSPLLAAAGPSLVAEGTRLRACLQDLGEVGVFCWMLILSDTMMV